MSVNMVVNREEIIIVSTVDRNSSCSHHNILIHKFKMQFRKTTLQGID